MLVALVGAGDELREEAARLEQLGVEGARTASFVSETPGADLARLAVEQDAELLLTGPLAADELERLLESSPCDVAVAPRPELPFEPSAPVLVPFGGAREEWAALELAAWLARAHALPLRLLGTEAAAGRRDASRLLASASLALQRFEGTASSRPGLTASSPSRDRCWWRPSPVRSWTALERSWPREPPSRSCSSTAACARAASPPSTR